MEHTYNWDVAVNNMIGLRKAKDIKLNKFSFEIGWDKGTIFGYEHGVRYPKIDYVIAFCKFFGIGFEDLFNENLLKEMGL